MITFIASPANNRKAHKYNETEHVEEKCKYLISLLIAIVYNETLPFVLLVINIF